MRGERPRGDAERAQQVADPLGRRQRQLAQRREPSAGQRALAGDQAFGRDRPALDALALAVAAGDLVAHHDLLRRSRGRRGEREEDGQDERAEEHGLAWGARDGRAPG